MSYKIGLVGPNNRITLRDKTRQDNLRFGGGVDVNLDVVDGSTAKIGVGAWEAVLDEDVRWQRFVEEIGVEVAIALVFEGVREAQSFVQLRLQQLLRAHARLNHQKLRKDRTCGLSFARVQPRARE